MKAPLILITIPGLFQRLESFIPVSRYIPSWTPEDGEIGLLLVKGKIERRLLT